MNTIGTNETATAQPAQDIASRIEGVLNPQEPIETNDDIVTDDGDTLLPEGNDIESNDDEGSVDEDSDDGVSEDEVSDDDLSLASYLGIDEDKLIVREDGTVAFNAVIDGEAKEVDLKELAKSYQMQGHVNNKSISLEKDRKEFEQVRDDAYTEMKTRLDGVSNLHNILEKQLLTEFNSINWEQLRKEDPSEWSALRQEYSERAGELQRSQQIADQEVKRVQDEQNAKASKAQSVAMTEQLNLMVVDNPTWADESVMKTEVGKIGAFLKSDYGFKDADLSLVRDRRLMKLIQDAKKYRDGKKGIAEKKVINKNLPKFQKPGATAQQAKALKKARIAKAKKKSITDSGGSVDSIAQSLVDRM